jgi:hypothetical protein
MMVDLRMVASSLGAHGVCRVIFKPLNLSFFCDPSEASTRPVTVADQAALARQWLCAAAQRFGRYWGKSGHGATIANWSLMTELV